MFSHRGFPAELIDQIIDELGTTFHAKDQSRSWTSVRCNDDVYVALRASSLVCKRWNARSRVHIFRSIRIHIRRDSRPIAPPTSVLPYVKALKVTYPDGNFSQEPPTSDFLKAFATSPIELFAITGGDLADKRACIREFIDVHVTTLRRMEFWICSLSPDNISDITLRRHCLKSLLLYDCYPSEDSWPPENTPSANKSRPDIHLRPSELELCISENDLIGDRGSLLAMVARLPCRFSRLDTEYLIEGEMAEAMNSLIKANADILSSLRVRICTCGKIRTQPEHLFNLGGCFNLSELTLDMAFSYSCAVQDSAFILSTLDPERSSHLRRIVLKAEHVVPWHDVDDLTNVGAKGEGKGGGDDDDDQRDPKAKWEELDAALSTLAEASNSIRRERLTFTLMVWEHEQGELSKSPPSEWLPKALPHFNELGSLYFYFSPDDH